MDTLTETPPPAATTPVQSSRATWPKTSQERAMVKVLVKKAYELAKDENGRIAWKRIKVEHPELYDQLMYWAADVELHFQQLCMMMRKEGELPEIAGADHVGTPKKGSDGRTKLAHLFDLLREHHADFPRNDQGHTNWTQVLVQFPEIAEEAKTAWPHLDQDTIQRALSSKMGKALKQKAARKPYTRKTDLAVSKTPPAPKADLPPPETPAVEFNFCPRCGYAARAYAEAQGVPLFDCLRCAFPIALSEQATNVRLLVNDQTR